MRDIAAVTNAQYYSRKGFYHGMLGLSGSQDNDAEANRLHISPHPKDTYLKYYDWSYYL